MQACHLFILLFLFPLFVSAQAAQESLIAASIEQLNGQKIACHYQLSQIAMPVQSIQATVDDLTLPILTQHNYPLSSQTTAILFLLDTSNPNRQTIVNQKKQHLKTLINQIKPHHHVGLAKFDSEFKLITPIQETPQDVLTALDNLEATGLTTELYRSTRDAVRYLATIEAERKAIYVFSDGKAEDTAYNHSDVVTEALKNNINIIGIGYSRNISETTNLAVLRRLSEETYGAYYQADLNTFALPETFSQTPFKIIDSGGRIIFDLSLLSQRDINQPAILIVNWETDHGTIQKQFPLNLASIPATPIEEPVEVAHIEPNLFDKYWWLFLLLAIALIFIFIILFFKRKKASDNQESKTEKESYTFSEINEDETATLIPFRTLDDIEQIESEETPNITTKPIACLLALAKNNAVTEKHPIYNSSVRIGRHKDNDIQLSSLSISSHHAEIHRKRDGQFVLNDLGSLNKVYLNNREIKQAMLNDEDLIQLGEIRLVFSLKNVSF